MSDDEYGAGAGDNYDYDAPGYVIICLPSYGTR